MGLRGHRLGPQYISNYQDLKWSPHAGLGAPVAANLMSLPRSTRPWGLYVLDGALASVSMLLKSSSPTVVIFHRVWAFLSPLINGSTAAYQNLPDYALDDVLMTGG